MPNALDRELAATVLLEAAYTTDEIATTKYGVSLRSLQRWRRQLSDGSDPELAGSVATKKAAFDAAWADHLPVALTKGLTALDECFAAVGKDEKARIDANTIHAVAGAVKIVAEIEITGKVIDARIGKSDNAASGLFGQSAANGQGRPYEN